MARIEQSIEVNVPVHAVYSQWTQFEEFPRFMEGVQEVRQLDDAHLHWRADRHGRQVEWDSEITDQVLDQHIAWRDVSGPNNTGSIRFQSVQADKTRVQIIMDCQPAVGSSEAAGVEQAISQRVAHDLARFKKLLESQGGESGAWRGEIHQGQSVHAAAGATPHDATDNPAQRTVGQTESERRDAAQSGSAASGSANGAAGENQQKRTGADWRASQQQSMGNETPGGSRESDKQGKAGGPQAWFPNLLQGWEEPMVMVRKMGDEMDQLFERFIGRPMMTRSGQGGMAGKWMPSVEISQRGDQLIICADLPGIRQEDVQIEINNDKLTIEGERREEHEQSASASGYRRSERSYGAFYRMIPLPAGVDPDSAQASMHNGVLEIKIPVPASPAPRGRPIDIQPPH
jgi:HSP20 family molecular chaperone IbpA